MPFSTTKDKIPKGFAYLLKSAALQEALLARGVSTDVHLAYMMSQGKGPQHLLVDGFFWLPNAHVAHDRFYLRTWAVPLAVYPRAHDLLHREALPQLLAWMAHLQALPADATQRRHNLHFSALLHQDKVLIQRPAQ